MGTGHHQNFLATQEFIVQDLRQRAKRNALVKHMLQFDVASRNGVSYNDDVRARLEICRRKRL